jgi:hypothetical protein
VQEVGVKATDEQIEAAIKAGRSTRWIVEELKVGVPRVNRVRAGAHVKPPSNMSTVEYLTKRLIYAEGEARECRAQLAAMHNVIERNQQLLAILDEIADKAKWRK